MLWRQSTGRSAGNRNNPARPGASVTFPGVYVKDHVRTLCIGGPDSPKNMQWQTTADAKAKDKWEYKN